jgi:hydroxymethylbilane synthase
LADRLVIGSRGSQLALWQSNWVKSKLEAAHPGIDVELQIITTTGDRVLNVSLPKLGEQGKGLFTKELEDAILQRRVDIAVHSLKDLPTDLPEGLKLGAVCEREDVRDALVARHGINSFEELPVAARIGTSSLRRQSQIRSVRPDLIIEPIRGNVDTRLRKLESGEYDALILAAAGLRRLGRDNSITQYLGPDLVLPAVGQGAVAVETREDDPYVNKLVNSIQDNVTRIACDAERSFLKALGGGCLVPIAALAQIEGQTLIIEGLVASPDGAEIVRGNEAGPATNPVAIGIGLADQLLQRGAGRLLART